MDTLAVPFRYFIRLTKPWRELPAAREGKQINEDAKCIKQWVPLSCFGSGVRRPRQGRVVLPSNLDSQGLVV
jgi:hypothetical protein